jgi:hypothetical protein
MSTLLEPWFEGFGRVSSKFRSFELVPATKGAFAILSRHPDLDAGASSAIVARKAKRGNQ